MFSIDGSYWGQSRVIAWRRWRLIYVELIQTDWKSDFDDWLGEAKPSFFLRKEVYVVAKNKFGRKRVLVV